MKHNETEIRPCVLTHVFAIFASPDFIFCKLQFTLFDFLVDWMQEVLETLGVNNEWECVECGLDD